jgi:hypothetical protein
MLEAFFYQEGRDERPETEEVLELTLKMACAEPDNEALAPVVRSLLRAFDHLRMVQIEEDEDFDEDWVKRNGGMLNGKEAETLFYKVYVNTYRKAHTRRVHGSKYSHVLRTYKDNEEDREEILGGAECPSALGYWSHSSYTEAEIFPRGFVCQVANVLAQRDAAKAVALAEHFLRNDPTLLRQAEENAHAASH